LLKVYAKLLSPEALFLAQNAPETVRRLGSTRVRLERSQRPPGWTRCVEPLRRKVEDGTRRVGEKGK